MNKICETCKINKSLNEFGNNASKKDGKQGYCKECGKLKDKKHYKESDVRKDNIKKRRSFVNERNRRFLIDYLLEHPCVECGESNPLYLDFDHVSGVKKYNISAMMFHCFETLNEEIAKCEIRCVKCHRRKTAIDFNWK